MNFDEALKWKKRLVPKSGYNVVAVDDFGAFEEQGPYFVSHHEREEDAQKACAAWAKITGEKCYVYGKDT